MKNIILDANTISDIDKSVHKILRGLGNPEPPLDLSTVLDLLNLDKQYYTNNDDGLLSEVINRLTVAGKQILQHPDSLWNAIRNFDLKALYIPEQKRIYIDGDLHKIKHRWNEAHEIAHEIIPWHTDILLGDDKYTLSNACHAQIEAEANYGAGRLLFLGKHFESAANDYDTRFKSILDLHNLYNNSITTTFWRFIECTHTESKMFGMISEHPYYPKSPIDPSAPCEYFIQSQSFADEFSADIINIYKQIESCCSYRRQQIIGEGIIQIENTNGQVHDFSIEIFCNYYQALTLGRCIGEHKSIFTIPGQI
ncbi:MAG TPA: DUF955 domain-containing protein [Desulfovibrio sp.]|nr:DUF955 domain-containing protein [Desulfovibrio sp.]